LANPSVSTINLPDNAHSPVSRQDQICQQITERTNKRPGDNTGPVTLRRQDELRSLSYRSHNPGKQGKFLGEPVAKFAKKRPGALDETPGQS
jgi:hypothetical protein